MRWVFVLLLLSACCPSVDFEDASFCVEFADDPEERTVGLMYVDHLPADSGMFFIFPQEMPLSFWMKNTLIPLDIIFLDEDMRVVDIKHGFEPCMDEPCESYTARSSAKYVLEVNSGLAEKYGIKEGDRAVLRE